MEKRFAPPAFVQTIFKKSFTRKSDRLLGRSLRVDGESLSFAVFEEF